MDGRSGFRLGPRAVLVPVKAFPDAKTRLAGAIDPSTRAALARRMAEQVLRAARPLPVAVVCDNRDVASWARNHRALVISELGQGLNQAVQEGVRQLADLGVAQVIVAHADLPLAANLPAVGRFEGITLVPDRRDDGTNVIAVPTGTDFMFSYGPGSLSRHVAEARRLGVALRVLRTSPLSWDIDLPADLDVLLGVAGLCYPALGPAAES